MNEGGNTIYGALQFDENRLAHYWDSICTDLKNFYGVKNVESILLEYEREQIKLLEELLITSNKYNDIFYEYVKKFGVDKKIGIFIQGTYLWLKMVNEKYNIDEILNRID